MDSNTVILGAGIIGCATAYYLSDSPNVDARSIHLVEASPELFASASGYAGGFLAADWFSPSVAALGLYSYRLHRELADKHNGRQTWGYSRSTGGSLSQSIVANGQRGDDWLRDGSSRAAVAGVYGLTEGDGPAWLTKRRGQSLEIISSEDTVAQVDPLRLSQFLLKTCQERGITLHQPARAISVDKDAKGQLCSVRLSLADDTEVDLPCTRLLITAGAWSPQVFSTLFPRAGTRIPITPLAGHSLLLRSPRWSEKDEELGCHAIFATDTLGFSPEIMSRLNSEIYVAGLNSSTIPLPNLPGERIVQKEAIEQLVQTSKRLLGLEEGDDDLEVLREGLCFRPVTPNGRPILSRVPDNKLGGGFSTRGRGEGGVFVSAGHGPWGISQSLGTGKTMAELIQGKKTTVDISALSL